MTIFFNNLQGIIKQAFTIANEMSWNREELEIYRYVNMEEAYDLSALRTAREEGIEQGTVKIAINLLDLLDDETIAKKTGLDLAKVSKLRKDRHKNQT